VEKAFIHVAVRLRVVDVVTPGVTMCVRLCTRPPEWSQV